MKKLKRLVCALLAAITVFSVLPASTVTTYAAQSFTDVPIGAYYEDAVQWAKTNGITSGTSATTYSPLNNVTRCQMLTFIWGMAGKNTSYGSEASVFTDVPADAYYRNAVGWAKHFGIAGGKTPTTFCPNDTITIAEAIVFMYKAYSKINGAGKATGAGQLQSISGSPYYKEAFNWANGKGYLATIPNFMALNKFNKDTVVNRGMAMYLLWEMKTGMYQNSRVDKMMNRAQYYCYNAYTAADFDFDTDWCEKFVGQCAMEAGMTGYRDSGCPIPESNPYLGEAGETIWRLLRRGNMYMPNEILQGSAWSNWRTRVTEYDPELELDKAKEIGLKFMPRRGDIFFVQKGGYTTIFGDDWFSHVGFVTKAEPAGNGKVRIYTIEGNTSGDPNASEYWRTSRVDTGVYVVNLATGKVDDSSWNILGFGRIS